MNGNLDNEFHNLKLHVDGGNEFYIHDAFRTEAFNYFSSQNQNDWNAFDGFFNRFIEFWSEEKPGFPFRLLKKYSEVKNVFEEILKLANDWEEQNPGSFVHKGTPYYFYGVAAIKQGDLEKGMLLMYQAVMEDRRYGRETSPALSFISLDKENIEHFFRSKVLVVDKFLEDILTNYRNNHNAAHNVNLNLPLLRIKFLIKKKFYDEQYLFVYSIFRFFRFKQEMPKYYLQNSLASYNETSLIFDLCKLCEILIKDKYPGVYRETMPSKYGRFCGDISTIHINQNRLDRTNEAIKHHFSNTISNLLQNKIRIDNVTYPLQHIEADLLLTCAFRNYSAHTIAGKKIIYENYSEIIERVLNAFFFIVEKKFNKK